MRGDLHATSRLQLVVNRPGEDKSCMVGNTKTHVSAMSCHGDRGAHLVDPEELVGLIGRGEPGEQVGKAGQDESVRGGESVIGDGVRGWREIVEVAQ